MSFVVTVHPVYEDGRTGDAVAQGGGSREGVLVLVSDALDKVVDGVYDSSTEDQVQALEITVELEP